MIGKPDSEGNFYPIGKILAIELASTPIEECDFSVRTYNVLRRCGAKDCLEVALMSEEDFFKIKNCGKKTIREITSFFKSKGIDKLPVVVYDLDQVDVDKVAPNPDDEAQNAADALEKLKNIRIADTNLSVRAINCCLHCNIITLYDFAQLSEEEALKIPNLGRKSFREIRDLIRSYGVNYPFGNIDFSNLQPSVKYMGVSDEAVEFLHNKNLVLVDDLRKLDSTELNYILSNLSIFDRNTIIYYLAGYDCVKLSDDYFDDYLKFAIEKLSTNLNTADLRVLSLAYGLFDNKVWPLDVLASTLAVSETLMTSTINDIVSLLIGGSNYLKLLPAVEYCKTKEDDIYFRNGYTLLLKYIEKLMNKGEMENE